MRKYLGEEIVDISKTEFAMFSKQDWALMWIEKYGGFDGSHHKDWVLDHIVRILKGAEIIISLAKWDDGFEEYRFEIGEPPKEYWEWVNEMKAGEDGENTYSYEFGVAP